MCVCVSSLVVQSKGMLEWVVEECVQPDLTMAAAKVLDRDDVLSVCVCVYVCVCVCVCCLGNGCTPCPHKSCLGEVQRSS